MPVTVTVYTRNNCSACLATKKQLELHGVRYTEINVEERPDIAQALVDDGWRAMPVVNNPFNGEWWSGMQLDKLRQLW